ncbi:SusD/RagB family nutrient-binding outer membrane lipoprotein [Hymenobacter sp. 15J16-1T3B]|uniref:SusD/RagB family nutrient-binding outer membrane lipoprotein n=1 Tax=Hymenobacter sp. 15J16-1T3B TaxID=2886941 RepID=UPI001D0FABE8|nr:SusD/RagB family nutrient-binding outer membrane lipoprotein [Hymenobacter sp. 15J16-1T3B]MCC3157295.1 SusD/RagB family nutrient-binding outer membrane lipoprotein [Hymenobacter sp. 15J16-1T3B]
MKIISRFLLAAALLSTATSCEKFLDINDNPNSATSATADQILASALVTTAANYNGGVAAGQNFNSYASWAAGYWGKSGVVNGYAEERTYNYTTSYYQNLWSQTYDNLNDYNLIQQQAAAYPNHAAIARIMKVYNFLLLVDEYGDIPYFTALKAAGNTTPSYDRAADIYKDFIVQLTGAVGDINAATGGAAVGAEDVVFRGDMTKWKKFANSLKLRILLRESQTNDATLNAAIRTEMTALQAAPDGFITTDVLVQPGYSQSANQQNPFYNRYGKTAGGTASTEQLYQIPTNYILTQYTSNNDPRVSQLYAQGLRNGTAQYVGTDLGERSPAGNTATLKASFFLDGGGLLKGPNAPTALMLLSEHLFNKAEAETRGLFTGGDASAKTDYQDGIKASFMYFYRSANGTVNTIAETATNSSIAGVAQYNTYIAANTTNPKVNYDLAPTGTLGKQEVIIYQKYLAENSVASTEAWDDYRRTGLPAIPASLESISTRPDKLPTRLLYPLTEINTNQANIPTGVDQFSKIFWDVKD